MFRLLMLLLPGLVPSWKFFKAVQPSPRVQWRVVAAGDDAECDEKAWQEYRPRPQHLTIGTMVRRLFWNPRWNENLFMVSLAERLTLEPTPHITTHSVEEIFRRVAREATSNPALDINNTHLQFRLSFVHREGEKIVEEITYLSELRPTGSATS